MKPTRRSIGPGLLGGLLLVATLLSPAAVTSAAQTPAGDASHKLVVAVLGESPGLDSMGPTDDVGVEIILNLYATVLNYKPDWSTGRIDPTQLIGTIADSWEVAPDNSSVTVHINPKATFADGSQITADDLQYTCLRGLANNSTQWKAGGVTDPAQCQVVDPLTFRLAFGGNFPAITRFSDANLKVFGWDVVKKDWVSAHATPDDPWGIKWNAKNPLSSGPYVLDSWKSGEEIVLKARADWWGDPKPYYDEIDYRIVPDSNTQLLLLRAGQIDIAYGLSPFQLSSLKDEPNFQIISLPDEVVTWRMNSNVPPFDDLNIRQAAIKAMPYDALIQQAAFGYANTVNFPCGVVPPGAKDYPQFTTNMAEARALVAKSKYAGGSAPPFSLVVPSEKPEYAAAATLIQASLADIGLTMQIQQLPFTQYMDNGQRPPQYPANIHTMGPAFADCLYWVYWMFSTNSRPNLVAYSNADVDALAVAALHERDPQRYAEMLGAVFDQHLVPDAVVVPLYQLHWNRAARKGLTGFMWETEQNIEFKYIQPAT
jgi:peptide/nickel transport system substrate-binding protein